MSPTRAHENDQQPLYEVEFIGGPYDGHKEPCFKWTRLPSDVVWFVCEDVFRLLGKMDQRPAGPITSVALYELEIQNCEQQYRFAGAISVNELRQLMRDT